MLGERSGTVHPARVVTFDDPAEAAQAIALASLLLRILDARVAGTANE